MQNRRADRVERPDNHALTVKWNAGLQVRCSCGAFLGGRRLEDAVEVTLSDLLELVRIHYSEMNSP